MQSQTGTTRDKLVTFHPNSSSFQLLLIGNYKRKGDGELGGAEGKIGRDYGYAGLSLNMGEYDFVHGPAIR
ncbi:hypothetical protein Ddc_11661 [Ditylenchus destructor]|nr:hypothetical protein Ddc_11661 [Ditylenchus destructor]